MILILTQSGDVHANYVEQKLRARETDVIRFNPAQFPSQAALSLTYTPTGLVRHTLCVGEEHVELHRLTAVWYRRPQPPVAHAELADQATRDYVEEECKTFVQDAWDSLNPTTLTLGIFSAKIESVIATNT